MTIDYAPGLGAELDSRAITPSPKLRALLVVILIFVGVMSFAAVLYRAEEPQCGPFTIGVSAVSGCDWIPGQ
jgi:hypothetical protein